MEIAERNLRYKCSDSIHILHSIVRNLSGIFLNHQKACWFRNSNLASSILDEGSSSNTNYNSELSLQNTFCCYLYAMQAHLSYFYLWNLEAGGINFLQSKQYHRQQKQKGQLGKANSQAVSSMEQHWGVQALAQEILAWLAPQDDQQQKCILKPLWKFSKVVYCHFVYIWISSRKGGVHLRHFCYPSLFPRHCKELFKLSLCYMHGEFFPHKPSSVTQHSLDKLVSLWFGWTMLICI